MVSRELHILIHGLGFSITFFNAIFVFIHLNMQTKIL